MRDRVKEGERLLKEKQRVGKESAMKKRREGKYLMAPGKESSCVANPDFLISGSQPQKNGPWAYMSDDYQITTAECVLSRVASKADQSDLVSELENYQKIVCQSCRGSSNLGGTDPSRDLTTLRWNMNTVCNVSSAALMLDDRICYGSAQFSAIHVF